VSRSCNRNTAHDGYSVRDKRYRWLALKLNMEGT
jgi:hypothetical protein